MRCIFCDDLSHKRGECDLYADALKEGIITFREGKINFWKPTLVEVA